MAAKKVPDSVSKNCSVITVLREQVPRREVECVTYKLEFSGPKNNILIFYLHGGGHAMPAMPWHWQLVRLLALNTGATVVMCLYPLSPEANAAESMACVRRAYDASVAGLDAACAVVLAGDSAGGGKSLTLAQQLAADVSARRPDGMLLFFPWLDSSGDNPALLEVDPLDPISSVTTVKLAGQWYAGDMELEGGMRDPRVSPLYGPTQGLPPQAIWQGTLDVFSVDSRAWVEKMEADGKAGSVTYYELPGVPHAFLLVSVLPETKLCVTQSAAHILAWAASKAPLAHAIEPVRPSFLAGFVEVVRILAGV